MTTATAALAGTPPAAAAPAAGATGVAGTPGATGAVSAPIASPAGTWYDGLAPENLAVLDAKGWKKLPTQTDALNTMLGSYRSMESTFTADKQGRTVVVPKEGADQAEIDAYQVKLGRPEKIDGYKVPETLKADPVAAAFRELAFKEGIPAKTFEKTMALVEAQAAGVPERLATQRAEAIDGAITRLRGEWAAGFDRNIQAARAATKKLGWDDPTIEAMAAAHPGGPEKFFRELSAAGQGLMETKNIDGTAVPTQIAYTPAEAKARMEALGKDKEFRDKVAAGNVAAKKEWSDLTAYRAGKTPEQMAQQLASGGGMLKG